MKLILKNNSDDSYLFLNGKITVAPNSQVEVDQVYWTDLSRDTDFIKNIRNGNLVLNDGILDYTPNNAESEFIKLVNKLAKEVITLFEKNDKVLRICSSYADVGPDGIATILIKVPGAYGIDNRYISYGIGWFDTKHPDDRAKVFIIDHDNIFGFGVDYIVGTYTDIDVPEQQQGWRIPYHTGIIEVAALGGYGKVPAGLYLKIIGIKGGGITTGRFYVNISWGVDG
jgi:hypothetical protein